MSAHRLIPNLVTFLRATLEKVVSGGPTAFSVSLVGDRISTHSVDLFTDPYPQADLHFYGMVFHDWPPERCGFLARKSFESLPPGGRIVLQEMLFNDDRTGPFAVAAFNVDMLPRYCSDNCRSAWHRNHVLGG